MRKILLVALALGLCSTPMVTWAQEGTPNPAAVKGEDVTEPVGDVVAPAPDAEVIEPAVDASETPDVVPAPPAKEVKPPTTDGQAVDVAMQAVSAARGGHWTLFAGLVLMLLIYVFNRFGMAAKLGTKAVPWVTAALGIVGSVAYGLANGDLWYVALIHGFFMSATAIAMWELVIKHLTDKKADGTPRTA